MDRSPSETWKMAQSCGDFQWESKTTLMFEIDKLNPTYLRDEENAKALWKTMTVVTSQTSQPERMSLWYIMGYISAFRQPEMICPRFSASNHYVQAWLQGNEDARGDNSV